MGRLYSGFIAFLIIGLLVVPWGCVQAKNAFDSGSNIPLTMGAGGNLAMTVDPASGQVTMTEPLIVGSDTSTTCTTAGAIRYNPTTSGFEGCNGSNWIPLGTAGVTSYFSFTTCAQGGNNSECSGTIPLSAFLTSGQMPKDTNYQIICTMSDITANNVYAAPSGFITISEVDLSSFNYIFAVFFDNGNHGLSVAHTANCVYHHA